MAWEYDIESTIYTAVKGMLSKAYSDINFTVGQLSAEPSTFPTIAISEVSQVNYTDLIQKDVVGVDEIIQVDVYSKSYKIGMTTYAKHTAARKLMENVGEIMMENYGFMAMGDSQTFEYTDYTRFVKRFRRMVGGEDKLLRR